MTRKLPTLLTLKGRVKKGVGSRADQAVNEKRVLKDFRKSTGKWLVKAKDGGFTVKRESLLPDSQTPLPSKQGYDQRLSWI